jgi:hypothetical protein
MESAEVIGAKKAWLKLLKNYTDRGSGPSLIRRSLAPIQVRAPEPAI